MFNFVTQRYWNEADNLFEDLFNDLFALNTKSKFVERSKKSSYPKLDIYDKGDTTVIEAAIPGMTKEEVTVTWENDLLKIQAQSQSKKTVDLDNYHVKELHKSSFNRSLLVDKNFYNVENIEAKVENGVLTVVLQKLALENHKTETKQIEVR